MISSALLFGVGDYNWKIDLKPCWELSLGILLLVGLEFCVREMSPATLRWQKQISFFGTATNASI